MKMFLVGLVLCIMIISSVLSYPPAREKVEEIIKKLFKKS